MTNETQVTVNNEKNLNLFLEALKALCEQYKASIGGCGCCGSPFVTVLEDDGSRSDRDDVNIDMT